jgi:hypothetical protein
MLNIPVGSNILFIIIIIIITAGPYVLAADSVDSSPVISAGAGGHSRPCLSPRQPPAHLINFWSTKLWIRFRIGIQS